MQLEYNLKTTADLTALKGARQAQIDLVNEQKRLKQDTSAAEVELKKMDVALTGEAAASIRAAEALEKVIAAKSKLGADASNEKAQLSRLKGNLGITGMDEFKSGMRDLASSIPGFDRVASVFSKFRSGGAGAIAGTFAGISVAAAAATKSISEFAGKEEAFTRVDAALAQTGQLSDAAREKLQALAGQYQEATAIGDEAWARVIARQIQFGASAENIDRNLEAVKNLAGIMGGDLESASNMVARAMQGNFTAFSRLGIHLDENATLAENLEQLFKELAERGGGQLENRAKTLSGQFQQFRNNVGDLWASFGRGIAQTGVLQSAMAAFSNAASHWANVFGGVTPQVAGMENAVRKTVIAADEAATGVEKAQEKMQASIGEANRELEYQLSLLDKMKTAEDREADARRDFELAKINANKNLSDADRAKAKAEVEQKFAAEQFQRDQEHNQKQKAAAQENIDDADADVVAAEKNFREQEKQKARAQAREKMVADAEEEKQKFDAPINKASEELTDLKAALGAFRLAQKFSTSREAAAAMEKLTPQQRDIFDTLKPNQAEARIAGLEAKIQRLQEAKDNSDASERLALFDKNYSGLKSPKEYDAMIVKAAEAFEALFNRFDEVITRETLKKDSLEIERVSREKTFGLETQTRGVNRDAEVNEARKKEAAELGKAIGENSSQNIAVHRDTITLIKLQNGVIADLKGQIATLTSQMQNSPRR